MSYNEGGSLIDTTSYGGTYVTKKYLLDVYPQLVDSAKSAGLWEWGGNIYGQLGIGNITDKSSPVQTVAGGTNWKQVSCSPIRHSAAIKTDGTLWLWGQNNYGVLGDNTVTYRSSPVQTIAGGTNWKQASQGYGHAAAIKTDGTLWLWGKADYGQLGTLATAAKSSPVQTSTAGTNWKQVACGWQYTGAIKTDGTLWLWGGNVYGQLGTNNSSWASSPIQTIAAGTNWKQIACGANHVAAIKNDGTLWTWGRNNKGQLGDNTTTHRSSPVQTVAAGTDWKLVTAGAYTTAAVKTDGTLWLWGDNRYGQIGDNTITHRSSPVQTVAGGTNWKLISLNSYHIGAIKTDGTLWLWGFNLYGPLGTNDQAYRSSPVQTITGGTNWKRVSTGGYTTIAIKDFNEDFN